MMNIFKSFLKEEKGQTMIEWIVILAVILIVVIVVLQKIGQKAKDKGQYIHDNF